MGAVRLNEIEAEYEGEVTIDWRSYLLRPEPEARPMKKFAEYTQSWKNPAELEPRATFNQWDTSSQPPSHSLPSAMAGKVAASQGPEAYRAFSERVFRAYFTENRTISDRGVLLAIATEAGLDRDAFDRYWIENEEEIKKAVFSDYVTAVESEITGVPAVVVDRTWLVPGAVDTQHYRDLIAQAKAQEEASADGPETPE